MKKVIISALIVGMLASLCACGTKETTNVGVDNGISSVVNTQDTVEEDVVDVDASELYVNTNDIPTKYDGLSETVNGITFYYPIEFQKMELKDNDEWGSFYEGSLITGDKAMLDVLTKENSEDDPILEKGDVEEFLSDEIWDKVDMCYGVKPAEEGIVSESEEIMPVFGELFLKRRGVMHGIDRNSKEPIDFRYVAYYGFVDGSTPIAWIVVSGCNNEGSEDALELVVNYLASNLEGMGD